MANEPITVLPDGSAFFLAEFPLPVDHWSLQEPGECSSDRDVPGAYRYVIRRALQWAYQTAGTKEPNHDPDALLQALEFALFGPSNSVEGDHA